MSCSQVTPWRSKGLYIEEGQDLRAHQHTNKMSVLINGVSHTEKRLWKRVDAPRSKISFSDDRRKN